MAVVDEFPMPDDFDARVVERNRLDRAAAAARVEREERCLGSVDDHAPIQGVRRDLDPVTRRLAGVGLALLVGDSPNRATVGHPRLWLAPDSSGIPHTANRLADWAELSDLRFRQVFDRTNVVTTFAPRWPREDARRRAEWVRLDLEQYPRPLILLGRRAADAFGLRGDLAVPYTWSRWRRSPETGKWGVGWNKWATPCGGPLTPELLRSALDGHDGWVPVAYARHPSSRSRVWNEERTVHEAREWWRATGAVLRDESKRRAAETDHGR